MKQNSNTIEAFDGELIHPSVDIKKDFMLLGFRYRSEAYKENDIFAILSEGSITLSSEHNFTSDKASYYIDKRKRILVRIEEKWQIKDLQQFTDDFNEGKQISVPGTELFNKIRSLLTRYVDLEKEIDYTILCAWILGTYFYQIFYAYPFLHIKAPKRSGKSQCLNLLTQLCFNAIKARPSLAALGDTVDSLRGTYLIDQCDAIGKKGNEDLLDILADSYKKSGGTRRITNRDKKGNREILEFETYSPKAFASIKELPEDLRDRCLIIPLIRSDNNYLDPDNNSEDWKSVRGTIYKYLMLNFDFLTTIYNTKKIQYKNNSEIKGRSLELWLPLEVILEGFGMTEYIESAKKRFLSQYGFTEYEPNEFEESVVLAVLNAFTLEETNTLTPKEITEMLSDSELPPEWTSKQKAAKVGWVIKKFNLSSEKLPRTKDGMQYLFEKKKVEGVYNNYFKSTNKPTPPTSEVDNPICNDLF